MHVSFEGSSSSLCTKPTSIWPSRISRACRGSGTALAVICRPPPLAPSPWATLGVSRSNIGSRACFATSKTLKSGYSSTPPSRASIALSSITNRVGSPGSVESAQPSRMSCIGSISLRRALVAVVQLRLRRRIPARAPSLTPRSASRFGSTSMFSCAASMKSRVSFERSLSVSFPASPKSTSAMRSGESTRMFAGCGSPWKNPCRKIIVIHASVVR